MTIIEGFGDLRYAHLIAGAPKGPPAAIAGALEHIYRENRGRLAEASPIAPLAARGLALELAVGFAGRGESLPESLIRLLAMAIGLPDDFPDDPSALYAGDPSDAAHRRARSLAMDLDARSIREAGAPLPLKALEREIAVRVGRAPSRSTLRSWRAEAEYRLFLAPTAKVATEK